MSANDGAASSSNVAAEGNFEPSTNNEAASSSNGDIITNSDQDAIMKKEAAAEGTHVDSQLYNMAAIIEGNIDPFNVREVDPVITPNKNTILHINIMSRNRSSTPSASTKFVEDILDRCPSLLFQVNVNAETLLHVAAKYGHSDIVVVLIKSSAKPQHEDPESGIGAAKRMLRMTNNEGNTALHEAVKYKHLDVVKILTKEDPDFTYASNNRGETPLYIAAAAAAGATVAAGAAAGKYIFQKLVDIKNPLEIVVEILKTCTKPAYEGPDQMTALHAAAIIKYHPDIIKKILEMKESLIKERDQYGWTPLHYAAYYRRSKTMKLLLECDISAAYIGDKHRKMTPLHIAIGQGYIPQEIISRCPDCCELVDKRRWNVLHFAMLSLTDENLKILLNVPLIRNLINDKDVDGNTPFHLLATFRSHLSLQIKDFVGDMKMDFGVVNNQNKSFDGVFNYGSDHLKQEILKLGEAAGPYRDGVVRLKKDSDAQNRRRQLDEEREKQFDKTKESHLIVAALIATVTFTAAFTLPGGVIQDGDKEGTAILSKKAAFQAFVITDAIAMVLSLSAVFAHFLMSLKTFIFTTEEFRFMVMYGARSTIMAMGAMVIAFVTGTYAMLTTSLWLAILTTFIGVGFFLLMFFIWKRANPI